jgi:hypothetical protein
MVVKTQYGEVLDGIILWVTVDMMQHNRLPSLLADAAGTVGVEQNPIGNCLRNRLMCPHMCQCASADSAVCSTTFPDKAEQAIFHRNKSIR